LLNCAGLIADRPLTAIVHSSISSFCVAVKSGLSINLRLYSGLDWPALALAAPKGMELTMCTMMGNALWCSNFSWAMS